MKDLILEFLKDEGYYPFEDFRSIELENIELADFLYWLGKRMDKE